MTAWLSALALTLSSGTFFFAAAQAEPQRVRAESQRQANRAKATYQRAYPYGYNDGYNAGRGDDRAGVWIGAPQGLQLRADKTRRKLALAPRYAAVSFA